MRDSVEAFVVVMTRLCMSRYADSGFTVVFNTLI